MKHIIARKSITVYFSYNINAYVGTTCIYIYNIYKWNIVPKNVYYSNLKFIYILCTYTFTVMEIICTTLKDWKEKQNRYYIFPLEKCIILPIYHRLKHKTQS